MMKKSKLLLTILQSILAAYALCISFAAPLNPDYFGEKIDFYTASVYELLGQYDFKYVLIFAIILALFIIINKKASPDKKYMITSGVLSCLFSAIYTISQFYIQVGYEYIWFGSVVNFTKATLCFGGAFGLFFTLIPVILEWMSKLELTSKSKNFFSKKAFLKAFSIMTICYLPFLILCYPGGLCFDVTGQIEQVLTGTVNKHHPILHTLWVGGMTKLSYNLFGTYDYGLYLYVIMQTLLLIASFAFVIDVCAKKKVKSCILWVLMGLFCITPIYTNLATMAVKDVPFTAFNVFYIVMLALLLQDKRRLRKPGFVVSFILSQIGVIVTRNNGLPLVVLTGIIVLIFMWKNYSLKERVKGILYFFAISLVVSKIILSIVAAIVGAKGEGVGEMLSLPFQQTAYTLSQTQNSLSLDDKSKIEAVLGDVDLVAAKYNPDSADNVKALYKKDSSNADALGYLGVWAKMGAKHPYLYTKALCVHIYGWFSPVAANEIRYETDGYDRIEQGKLFKDADKVLIFLYRFADRISLLGILENCGIYSWCLCLIVARFALDKNKKAVLAFVPLMVSLLVCIAAPCFYMHPRYMLPVMATLPALSVIVFSGVKENANE